MLVVKKQIKTPSPEISIHAGLLRAFPVSSPTKIGHMQQVILVCLKFQGRISVNETSSSRGVLKRVL